jgi:hypothetical protein
MAGPEAEAIVRRVVVSPKDAPVTRTALVLSDAILAQLVIKGPLPSPA